MSRVRGAVVAVLLIVQSVLAVRVAVRLIESTRGRRIDPVDGDETEGRAIVLVSVLNEVNRLAPCLEGLLGQGPAVREILVGDGGSNDGTPELVVRFARCDPRVRLLASPPPRPGENGEAHNLAHGLIHPPIRRAIGS